MTPATATPPEAKERVLSTLNKDGSRRWLHPRLSTGRFLTRRRIAAYALIALFAILPWISINGRQSILIDLPAREFTFFGTTFLPTDTLLLALLVAGVFVTVFLVTALFGRIWCGWACPQTVYMEFVYRPIERFFSRGKKARGARTAAKYATYLVVSLALAHVFLAYFVSVDELFRWVRQSPFQHPTAFLVMAVTTGLMMFDFCFFREQTCIVACPYGRFQSVMLDRKSLIISYDQRRGEPRGKLRRGAEQGDTGDCVACSLCVVTCPTGIDIREGLQMECIGCAQCIDACDAVMDKVGRPRGLIRYSSEAAMEGQKQGLLRPRVILYPALLAVIGGAFLTVLLRMAPADITLLRASGRPYVTLESGEIANELRIKVVNRTDAPRSYEFGVEGLEGARLECPDMPVTIAPGAMETTVASIVAPAGRFHLGRATVEVVVSDDDGYRRAMPLRLQGPWSASGRGHEHEEDEEDRDS